MCDAPKASKAVALRALAPGAWPLAQHVIKPHPNVWHCPRQSSEAPRIHGLCSYPKQRFVGSQCPHSYCQRTLFIVLRPHHELEKERAFRNGWVILLYARPHHCALCRLSFNHYVLQRGEQFGPRGTCETNRAPLSPS